MSDKKPKPPTHLKKRGRELWNRITGEFELLGHDFARLEAACVGIDRADEARQAIDRDGSLIEDRFGILKEHPACRLESAAWNQVRLALRELGIDSPPTDTRPATSPRGYK